MRSSCDVDIRVTLIGTKPQAGNEFEVLHSSTEQYEVIVDKDVLHVGGR